MKGKKAQLAGIAIFLIVIALILLAVILTYVMIKTRVITFNTNPTWGQPQIQAKIINEPFRESRYVQETVCYSPYIKIGNNCCLDQNINRICDNDEKQVQEPELKCDRPYMKSGNRCCLDDNDNRRCDIEEDRFDRDDKYNYNYNLNGPFDITDINIDSNDDLELEIKNTGDEDLTIKKIDIDKCDLEHPDRIINNGDRESFDFDCDFSSHIDSDIEVDYTVGNSTDVKTAYGNIEED